MILDTLPIHLNCFQLALDEVQLDFVVDDCKGESISSIAKRVLVSESEVSWIQYSHFDPDEESFGFESLYVS
ncbi:unnamed protein product [Ambrosiozyma monospora]|uniref:Unnamed protein product n=1 Tax=Ambrosiozyma monospora TaxID=43982 RepID=A0ACB5SSF6_AMBMO|nr:unnamed protein product [Ambrosiozyma monospora]